jgi:glucosyl-3-phosphoglycerate synthase
MSDFFQSNHLTTLQRLRPNPQLEEEVTQSQRKIVVVVPCLASHYKHGILRKLLECIQTVSCISEIVVVLNGSAGELESQDASLAQSVAQDTLPIKILLCEGLGKGRAIKTGFDYVYHRYNSTVIVVTFDADFQSFSREYLFRLVYPIAVLGGRANKGYYARFSSTTLNGRLTRLLVFPMLHAIQEQCPTSDLNRWLLSFRYPLSGDVALASEILPHLKLEGSWAYDLSLLTSLFQYKDDNSIYQTDLLDNYEHSHRDLSGDRHSGLIAVFADIENYLMKLFPVDRNRLILDYRNLAQIYCSKYEQLAKFNGIEASDRDRQLVYQFIDHLDGSLDGSTSSEITS